MITFADFGRPSPLGALGALIPQQTHSKGHPWLLSDSPQCLVDQFTRDARRDMNAARLSGDRPRFEAASADLADVLATGLLSPAQRRRAVHKWRHARAAQTS